MISVVTLTLLVAAADDRPPPEIERALFGTVLLVTQLEGGLASYGSGVVVDKSGLVLTNLHVLEGAKAVYALTYDPEKPSYAAVDGGLDRLMFERQPDLIPVSVIRGDPTLDLAVVRLDNPASIAFIPIASAEPAIGSAVIAVGHPEQNFWTITRGQISAKHNGMLQHDAAVNKGNSGGPLLNAAGELIGINTMFLKGAQGIYYARPIGLAGKLVDVVKAPLVMDRSTPEKAVMACARARELGDPSVSQCIHWGSHYVAFRTMLDYMAETTHWQQIDFEYQGHSVKGGGGGPKSKTRATVKQWLETGDGRADVWVTRYGPLAMQWLLSDDPSNLGKDMDAFLLYVQSATRGGKPPTKRTLSPTRTMKPAELRVVMKQVLAEQAKHSADAEREWRREHQEDPELMRDTGLKVPVDDVAALRRTLKMGLRVEKTQMIGADHAWVALAGRNLDGSPYRYAVLMKKEPDGWREEVVKPFQREAKRKNGPLEVPPAGFPPHMSLTSIPLSLGAMIAGVLLAVGQTIEDPSEFDADFDFEHTWPVMMALLRADNDTDKTARAMNMQTTDVQSAAPRAAPVRK